MTEDRLKVLEEALRAWEAWEADMILDDSSWSIADGFRVTGPLYHRYIELQTKRNAALATNAEPQRTAVEEDYELLSPEEFDEIAERHG